MISQKRQILIKNMKTEVPMNNKILVVDDESRIRKIIRDFLVREGYVVCEAEDGEAALDIFAQTMI